MLRAQLLTAATLLAAATAQTPLHQTIPAAYDTAEANSLLWVAGTGSPVHQQTLIGASHLTHLVGRELTALVLRRAAFNGDFEPAAPQWTIHLSHTNVAPLQCRPQFAHNTGANAQQVFQGQVQVPQSPANTSNAIPWTTANTIRAEFQTPFVYTGGTLCLDLIGTPTQGQTSRWWVADAVWEDIPGSAQEIGAGCGAYGGPQSRWAFTDIYTLMPGARASFWALGAPNSFGVAVIGAGSNSPIPLAAFGLPAPGCDIHLNPAFVLMTTLAFFEADPNSFFPEGKAHVQVQLPAAPWVFGMTLATQWFDFVQPASSNALQWTVAGQLPTLDLAHVDGVPNFPEGNVTLHLAPVYRFEYR